MSQGLKVAKSVLLTAEHLSWSTDGNLILDDISFAVEQGSFTGILGPNGAGKSSLLRCLYRFVKPEQGIVTFDHHDIWQLNANDYAKNVAVVLQETPSHFNLTVHDVVALGLIPHKGIFARANKADDEKIAQAIEQVGLAHKVQQNFEHLSGGEKQRAVIARAIVQSPSLLIMDEPTSHLDVRYQIQIMELAKSLGITVIASFHDLNLASAMCDNILVLNQGKLVCQGTPKEVLTREMLSDVFGVCAHISEHHQHKVPHISYYYGYIQVSVNMENSMFKADTVKNNSNASYALASKSQANKTQANKPPATATNNTFVQKKNGAWLDKKHISQPAVTVLVVLVGIFSLFCALSFGAADISFADVWHSVWPNEAGNDAGFIQRIIWELRMPRAILALLAGSGLAISGLILQTVTRNPLADPYLFGISSGASLGVVILIAFTGGIFTVMTPIAAFAGSLVAMLMLMLIAGRRQSQQVESMLLAGVALSFLFSSFTSLLLYHTDPQAVTAVLFWTMGSFSRAQWENLLFPTVVITACITFMLAYRRQLNAMLLGDESATTLGIKVNRFRLIMLLLSSLITATLVSMCGGIGFVGLMIPHIVRFFISQGTVFGILLTALVGGIFMIWVDILSRTILVNQELPVGVITAAIGSLFFLTLLYFRKNRPS